MTVRVPPKGTRGIPFPRLPGFLARRVSRMQLGGFRKRGGGRTRGGLPALVLHTVGARSGEPRTAMLGYVEDGPGAWFVVASLAGSARNPGWLYNLANEPRAEVELADGTRRPVVARTLEDAELEAAWRRFETEGREYVEYLSKTDRQLPVVRLETMERDAA